MKKFKIVDRNANRYIDLGSLGWRFRDVVMGVYDHIEVLQYIGVKDETGIQVFEGDIVEFMDEDWYVSYYEDFCCWILKPVSEKAHLGTIHCSKTFFSKLKITGNINIIKEDDQDVEEED